MRTAPDYAAPMTASQQGHVFVVHGDITKIVVDSWILPTDRSAKIRSASWGVSGSDQGELRDEFSPDFRAGKSYAERLPWAEPDHPIPVCTAVPDSGVTTVEDLTPRLEAGLALAATIARERATDNRVPRIAMPTFGSDGGGGGKLKGSFLKAYLELAQQCAQRSGVDVVIVTNSKRSYTGLQLLRCDEPPETRWPSLPSAKAEKATELARMAQAGTLTPFMGAGVSVSSGLPDWDGLLLSLRATTTLTDITEEDFKKLSSLDRADLLETELGDGMKEQIAEATRASRIGLPPLLLAALPSREAVTLNYDTLFEDAKASQSASLAVLPRDNVGTQDSWLLKLHGSTDQPKEIVLTRHDYLGYAQSRSALSSLATALLMTKHLLFVGFGFSDDHFHQLLHDVRAVYPPSGATLQPDQSRRLGTALVLGRNPVRQRLWDRHVEIVAFDEHTDTAGQARSLEIFLDMLIAQSVDSPIYFLRDEYSAMLNDTEHELASQFADLMELAGRDEIHPTVRRAFYQLRRSLGGPVSPQ